MTATWVGPTPLVGSIVSQGTSALASQLGPLARTRSRTTKVWVAVPTGGVKSTSWILTVVVAWWPTITLLPASTTASDKSKVSSPSTRSSLRMGMVTVCRVSPGSNVTVPDAGV